MLNTPQMRAPNFGAESETQAHFWTNRAVAADLRASNLIHHFVQISEVNQMILLQHVLQLTHSQTTQVRRWCHFYSLIRQVLTKEEKRSSRGNRYARLKQIERLLRRDERIAVRISSSEKEFSTIFELMSAAKHEGDETVKLALGRLIATSMQFIHSQENTASLVAAQTFFLQSLHDFAKASFQKRLSNLFQFSQSENEKRLQKLLFNQYLYAKTS